MNPSYKCLTVQIFALGTNLSRVEGTKRSYENLKIWDRKSLAFKFLRDIIINFGCYNAVSRIIGFTIINVGKNIFNIVIYFFSFSSFVSLMDSTNLTFKSRKVQIFALGTNLRKFENLKIWKIENLKNWDRKSLAFKFLRDIIIYHNKRRKEQRKICIFEQYQNHELT